MSTALAPARSATRRYAPQVDGVTVALTACIVLLGLIMVTSASITLAGSAGAPFAFLERQLAVVLLGTGAGAAAFAIPTERLERLALPLLLVAVVLLTLVLVPGLSHVINGSRRWLRVAGVDFQASEVARVLVLIYVASYAVRHEQALQASLAGVVRPLLLLAVIGVLLLLEPDFGAASVLLTAGFGVLYLAGARLRWIALTLLAAGSVMTLAVLGSSYRLHRLTSFMNPWAHALGGGFQLTQSLIAIGRGGVFGVGLGESVQKLFYLPEAPSDFLFAVLAEELGLAGVLLTLALFLALSWRAFVIGRRAYEAGLKFPAYLACGFGLWLGAQAFINIGVNMGVLPTKGLTLPLMSYGRSSMGVTLAWIGIVLRVHHETLSRYGYAARAAVSR